MFFKASIQTSIVKTESTRWEKKKANPCISFLKGCGFAVAWKVYHSNNGDSQVWAATAL